MDLTQFIILISLLSFMFVGFFVKKSSMRSYAEFTMSKNKLRWFIIATGISMAFAGGATILTTASLGHLFKWYALVDPLAVMIGLLIVVCFYKLYRQDKGTTISDLLSSNDKRLKILIGFITSMTFIFIVSSNFVALSKLLAPYFPKINPLLITFVVSSLVFSYVFFGGFDSVTRTDIMQYILIVAFLIIPILFFIGTNYDYLSASVITHQFAPMPLDYIILFSMPILFIPLSQDINLRIKSAKNQKNGKIGLIMGGFFYFSIFICAAFIGIYLGNHNIELQDPEQAVPLFFKIHFPKIGFLAIVASLSAIVSTLDSCILNSITSISNDIIDSFSVKKMKASHTIKIASFITYVMAMSIALFFNKILFLALTSLLMYISVLAPIVWGRILYLSEKKIFIGSIVNIALIVVNEITSSLVFPKAVMYPIMGCLIMLLLRLASRQKVRA